MKPKVYVSGPLSQGNLKKNVEKAIEVGEKLHKMGFLPFIPHLSVVWHDLKPHDHDWWVGLDLEYIDAFGFDLCVRIPGYSPGADDEEAHFTAKYIRTISSEDEAGLAEWKAAWDERGALWNSYDRLAALDAVLSLPRPVPAVPTQPQLVGDAS